MSDKAILYELSNFGLSEIEGKIYLYLLGKEPLSIVEIAREMNLPRTTIYDNILKVVDKGLIKRHILYKTQKFEASPITIFQTLLDREKSRLETLEKGYKFLQQNIEISFLNSAKTEVKYYHGASGFMQMMWNALSADKETVGYSEFGRAEIVGQNFLDRWIEELTTRKLTDRVIANPTDEIKKFLGSNSQQKRKLFQQTRFIEKDQLYISGDTTIYNNVFAVAYWKQGEVVGAEIENSELVKTQKSIFEQMWKLAVPLPIS